MYIYNSLFHAPADNGANRDKSRLSRYYQEEGSPKRIIKKGDVIVSPVDVRHWNGATPDKQLVCLTVTEHSVDGHVVQLRAVTEEEYKQ